MIFTVNYQDLALQVAPNKVLGGKYYMAKYNGLLVDLLIQLPHPLYLEGYNIDDDYHTYKSLDYSTWMCLFLKDDFHTCT